jgi:hypothetical protein
MSAGLGRNPTDTSGDASIELAPGAVSIRHWGYAGLNEGLLHQHADGSKRIRPPLVVDYDEF